MQHRVLAALLVVVVAVASVVLVAAPVSAHATLESTSPGDGAVVHTAVRVVTATFDQAVGVSSDSIRVYGPDGARVDVGGTHQGASPAQMEVGLPAGVPDGTYTVAWHVVSADAHPVQGAFTFSIGHPSSHVAVTSVGQDGPGSVRIGYGVVRAVGYLAYAVLAGGLLFVAWCWPAGAATRRTRRLLVLGWIVSLMASVFTLLLQGVFASGLSLARILDGGLIESTLRARFGVALMARLLLTTAAGFAVAVAISGRHQASRQASRWYLLGCAALVPALAATWTLTGHSSVGRQLPVAFIADVAHLSAMALWVGGIVMLFTATLRQAAPAATGGHAAAMGADFDADVDVGEETAAVTRFSAMAGWCVAVLIVTGTYQTWRDVGSWAALAQTTSGRLILAKIVGIAVLVLLGYGARRQLGRTALRHRARPDAGPVDLRGLRRRVCVELVVLVSVLGLSAALVDTPTGRQSYHPAVDATREFHTGTQDGTLAVIVTPARIGPETVQIVVRDAEGALYRPAQVTASLTLPSEGIGPLSLPITRVSTGRYTTRPVPIDVVGTWNLTVVVRSDAFDEDTVVIPVPIT